MVSHYDLVIIGAGAAGLAAAAHLNRAGISILILEARQRAGGRMFTSLDPVSGAPIELGAEFLHGKPPETWNILKEAGVKITEVDGDSWCFSNGHLSRCGFFEEIENILAKMDDSSPDESFQHFLDRCWKNPHRDRRLEEARDRALAYISGFNAADPRLVGVHWLVQGARAEERIEGHRAFRPAGGYNRLIELLERKAKKAGALIELQSAVETIEWKRGLAAVAGLGKDGRFSVSASRVLVTVPLGVLQASPGHHGAIRFSPALPAEKRRALQKLEMGKVVRVVLRFRRRFWSGITEGRNKRQTLSKMSFLFTSEEVFPTWWTAMPGKFPIITGWAPFRSAERLAGKSEFFIFQKALLTLARVLKTELQEVEREFESGYFHDWDHDPFSRGAYSYGKVGSDGAQQALGRPVENTLFFAGEATDTSGNNGTVHGALASGQRAAGEILSGLNLER